MKKKLIGILVCMMMIATLLPAVSSIDENYNNYPHFEVNGVKDILLPIEGPKREIPKSYITGGFLPPEMDLSHLKGDEIPEEFMNTASLQQRFDWRAQSGGKVTTIKDQGICGACYAFAGIANFESQVLIDTATNPPGPDYSENNAKECNWREINSWVDGGGNPWGGCAGGDHRMLASLFSQKGVVLESCDPYVQNDVGGCTTTCTYQKTLLDWRMISANNIPSVTTLKNYIQNVGPVYTTLYVGDSNNPSWQSTFNSYTSGVLYYPSCPYTTNHAVLIIGWDDTLGGSGAWIVRNSWGKTWWGSTCGYGTEIGYFYIEYGSANIGHWSSTMDLWQNYDSNGGILYYDEDCWSNNYGYSSLTAWGLCKYIPSSNIVIKRVEFWTNDKTTDVDVYLYDNFDGTSLSNLLWSSTNNAFAEAGYHGVTVSPTVNIGSSNDVIAVVQFTNNVFTSPVATDANAPSQTGRTYMSSNGASGSWTDMGTFASEDVGIRIRYSLSSNNPPNTPSNPNPANHATGVDINADLSWSGGDPDSGDTVTYDLYFDTNTPPTLANSGLTSTSFDPGTMPSNTKYYWQIKSWDNHGASTTGPIWDFTTAGTSNNPPNTPSNPNPSNHATGIDVNADLSWTCSDPDTGDTLTYDVYFGTTTSPSLVSSGQTSSSYDPGTMNPGTKYYWKIDAWDNHGATTPGPLWDFTTASGSNNPPTTPSIPNGPTSGIPGVKYRYTTSATDPDAGDQIKYGWDFDNDGIVKPEHWTGFLASGVTCNVDITFGGAGTYYLSVIAEDNHGAQSSFSPALTVVITTGSNNPPTVAITSPSPGATVSGTISIQGTAADSDGTVTQVEVKIDSGSWWTASGTTSWSTNFDTNIVSDGLHTIYAQSIDDKGAYSTLDSVTVTVNNGGTNNPPTKPSKPSGPASGKTGTLYPYSTSSSDIDGDKIKYGWDWTGNGIVDQWDDNGGSYYTSGTPIITSHSWSSQGTYNIKVIAEDIHGEQSPWSDPLSISIPKNKAYINTPFLKFMQQYLQLFQILQKILQQLGLM